MEIDMNSNIFTVAHILRTLHMLTGSTMISNALITKTIEQNFRIKKFNTETDHQFYQRFEQDFENGVYTAYLYGREERRKFYLSNEWLSLKKRVMKEQDNKCVECGATRDLQVDHIQSRYHHPELELEYSNCQIMCRDCNMSKSSRKK